MSWREASPADVSSRPNRTFIAAVLERDGGSAASGVVSPRAVSARSPRASVGMDAMLPADLTAEAIAALSRHTHHSYDLPYGGVAAVKRSGKRGMALWGKSLKLGVTTPAMIGRCVCGCVCVCGRRACMACRVGG